MNRENAEIQTGMTQEPPGRNSNQTFRWTTKKGNSSFLTMSAQTSYVPSKLLAGDAEILRQHSFTRWMTRDLAQAAVDFNRNLGLLPAYSETSPDHLTRYLFGNCPKAR